METKDAAEKTAPSVARAKLAPKPEPAGEPESGDFLRSVTLTGLEDDSL